jgi:hypothetical protein
MNTDTDCGFADKHRSEMDTDGRPEARKSKAIMPICSRTVYGPFFSTGGCDAPLAQPGDVLEDAGKRSLPNFATDAHR